MESSPGLEKIAKNDNNGNNGGGIRTPPVKQWNVR